MRMFESISPYYEWISEDGKYASCNGDTKYIFEIAYGLGYYYQDVDTGEIFKKFATNSENIFLGEYLGSISVLIPGKYYLDYLTDFAFYSPGVNSISYYDENDELHSANYLYDKNGDFYGNNGAYFSYKTETNGQALRRDLYKNNYNGIKKFDYHSRYWKIIDYEKYIYELFIDDKATSEKMCLGTQLWVFTYKGRDYSFYKKCDELTFFESSNHSVFVINANNETDFFELYYSKEIIKIKFKDTVDWKKGKISIDIFNSENIFVESSVFTHYRTSNYNQYSVNGYAYNYVYDIPTVNIRNS